jgi:CubicO group peptidase (beta-lactamase class C family)
MSREVAVQKLEALAKGAALARERYAQGGVAHDRIDPSPVWLGQRPGFLPQRTRNLVQVLQREVDSKRLPGAVALIARRGQVLLHETVGQQDPVNSVPMGLDAIFRIYSMTKPIVSVAVMMLMERGQLLLSDPVAQHLPELKTSRSPPTSTATPCSTAPSTHPPCRTCCATPPA